MDAAGQIAFLDLLITKIRSAVSTCVYRKPTNNDVVLNYGSASPKRYKVSVIRSYVYRAYTHCSTWASFHEELERVQHILLANGYPTNLVNGVVKEVLADLYTKNNNAGNIDSFNITLLPLQYRGLHTVMFARRLCNLVPSLRVVYTTAKLRNSLPLPRTKIETRHRSKVIYQYSCPACNNAYVGKTKRHLCTRIKEHRKGPLFLHHSTCSLEANVDVPFYSCFSVVDQALLDRHLYILEAMHIHDKRPTLNTQITSEVFKLVLFV